MSQVAVQLARLVRNGFVESVHYGSLLIARSDGRSTISIGEVNKPIFPRSSVKPFQAVAMVHQGLTLPAKLLAVAAASHSGSMMHIAAVREILTGAGLDESALQCPPDRPYGQSERIAYGAAAPARIVHNCSGKHSSMLATCVINGWPIDTYRDPNHPLQLAIRAELEEAAEEKAAAIGIDGCGAPLFAISLSGLARAFTKLVTSNDDAFNQVSSAMRRHPEMVGGEKRFTTELMRLVPGLLVKEGAEGVEAAVDQFGNAVVFKIADGSMRAIPPILIEALKQIGIDQPALTDLAKVQVTGGDEIVGQVEVLPLIYSHDSSPQPG